MGLGRPTLQPPVRTPRNAGLQGPRLPKKTVTGYVIQVKGYASAVGSAALNQQLSQERAANGTDFPDQQCHIPLSSVLAPGAMGTSRQVAPDSTAEGQAENRRVVVRVLQNKGVGGRNANAQTPSAKKPNILVIFGDDIGYWNVNAYNQGMMHYATPNIDRIAHEGALFTDYYAQQSCTAGRAAFITGQRPIRTGLTKVGLPGSPIGLYKEDPTLAELLKPLGLYDLPEWQEPSRRPQ